MRNYLMNDPTTIAIAHKPYYARFLISAHLTSVDKCTQRMTFQLKLRPASCALSAFYLLQSHAQSNDKLTKVTALRSTIKPMNHHR